MSNLDFRKLMSENEDEYVYRICSQKDIIGSWKDVADIINENLGYAYDESAYRKKFQSFEKIFEAREDKIIDSQIMLDEINKARVELSKERVKLQTAKLEYNKWIREDARDEMFLEQTIEAIRKYSPTVNPPKPLEVKRQDREGLLCIADCHFGKEFKIYGLYDEIINEYSPEIFKERMSRLLYDTIEQIEKENLSTIYIFNLGDHIEGFIRNSQIWSLRYGAIDSAVLFGNYMGEWLGILSNYANVIYHQTDGNHDEMRLLDGKKGQHLCESAGKIVKNSILIKNEKNPNFKFVENKTGLIFENICGFNILGVHGEEKSLKNSIKSFSNIYNVDLSYIIAGHKHHRDFEECGVRKGCIGVGSIVGADDFSMKIKEISDASASFFVFEKNKGKVDEHTCVLS